MREMACRMTAKRLQPSQRRARHGGCVKHSNITTAPRRMNAPALRFETRQSQAVTPRLQHSVRLLQLSSLDFAQEVQEAMGRNPFLEMDEAISEAAETEESNLAATPMQHTGSDAAPDRSSCAAELPDQHADDDSSWDRESWGQSRAGASSGSDGSEVSLLDLATAEVGLRAHLRTQANVLPLSARDHVLVCAVIESLDDDGYLRLGLDELAELTELVPAVDRSEMNTALSLVQSMEPCGVAARNLGECLTLQLQQCQGIDTALARGIVAMHLDRLAQRDVPGLSRLLGRSRADIENACQQIRQLDPRPGWRFGGNDVHYVTPDVIVHKVRGKWAAKLNAAILPRVRLNSLYADLFQRHRGTGHVELAAHLKEARWTMRNVQQRFSTILAIAEAILKRQHHFLEFGPLAMRPLGLKEIADEVGVHESTVCRVTNNKYMATPAGMFELKFFFSRAMPTASGGACTGTAIRGLIKDMIESEDPGEPLSDVDLARKLDRQGLKVARRTITKYRQLLKFAPADRRRRGANSAGFSQRPSATAMPSPPESR